MSGPRRRKSHLYKEREMKYKLETLKPMIPVLIMLSLIIFAAETYGAETDFQFGQITARGTGCPAGSVDIVKTDDKKTASILFNEMLVEVPQFDGDNENDELDDDNRRPTSRFNQNISVKVCNIVLNADIPAGHRITSADISIDYRGAAFLDQGTQALFHSKFLNFTGPQRREHRVKGTVVRKVWRNGGVDEDFTFSESKTIDLNSNCGRRGQRNTKIVLKNVIKAGIKRGYENTDVSAFLSLDSQDMVGKMKIKLNTQLCGNGGGGHNGGNNGDVRPKQCRRGFTWDPHLKRCTPKRQRPPRRPRRPRHPHPIWG